MKWAYSIREKGKTAFLLAFVLVMVSMVTLIEKSNVSELGTSFSSVYEDRLVVESYIYKFSDYLYQKKLLMDDCSSAEQLTVISSKIQRHNEAIRAMIAKYEQTKLTKEEFTHFNAFKKDMEEIMALEKDISDRPRVASFDYQRPLIEKHVDDALSTLEQLSGIQISEGKILNENSKKIMAGSEILSQFELAMLIVVGLMIQMLIFASNSMKPKFPQNPHVN
jgi:hypothetical protein